jgi:hypothetical protein
LVQGALLETIILEQKGLILYLAVSLQQVVVVVAKVQTLPLLTAALVVAVAKVMLEARVLLVKEIMVGLL